jgi:hypothetical protein
MSWPLGQRLLLSTREAESTIRELRSRTNLNDREDRRKAVEALLQRLSVKTVGTGRDKRVEITIGWVSNPPRWSTSSTSKPNTHRPR